MTVKSRVFDEKHQINEYTLSNSSNGLIVKIIEYGATITQILVNDKNGVQRDVVLGWDDLDGYLGNKGKNPFFGAVVGRCANRITNAKFDLNGKTYKLAVNNGPNALHGGIKGFDKRKWNLLKQTNNSITLGLTAEDGEEGYPGHINVELIYTITESNELRLEYSTKMSENQSIETIVNLTNHSYFNLNGSTNEEELDVLNHTVRMKAENYIEVNDLLQPTGKILSVKSDSPLMDFSTTSHTIGERINGVKPNGYDHCYVIETNDNNYNIRGGDSLLKDVVVVSSGITGIRLSFSTTEPGFQFYTGNNLTTDQKTKKSQSTKQLSLRKNSGFCLEASRFPNAINEEKWRKQVILNHKQTYSQTTVYKFDIKSIN